ncbi:hypothetical protein [Nocardiopsis synnemataformans]
MNDQVAQKIADRLNELADTFADHVDQAVDKLAAITDHKPENQ